MLFFGNINDSVCYVIKHMGCSDKSMSDPF